MVDISSISADSRNIQSGSLFIAVEGQTVDGHQFVEQVVEQGCRAVVVKEHFDAAAIAGKAVIIKVADPATVLGIIAANFYGNPARSMRLIGITGTNGKTTTSFLIEAMLAASGGKPGVIGTVAYRYDKKEMEAPYTTPDPVMLNKLLREMSDSGVTHVVMEVSSHALMQKRLSGLFFDVAVFTNLSRDHLDYHGDMEHYFAAKKKLFTEHLAENGVVVICENEETAAGSEDRKSLINWGKRLKIELQQNGNHPLSRKRIYCCGQAAEDIFPETFKFDLQGLRTIIKTPAGRIDLQSPLVGRFNLNNLLVATGVGSALGIDPETIRRGLASAHHIPGRLERLTSASGVDVFVDYAHTPDAMENVIMTLREVKPQRLIVIFGCGGDRDRGKRPIMGEVAARLADIVVVTSDNPRTEDPQKIILEIEEGIKKTGLKHHELQYLMQKHMKGYEIIESRQKAIAAVISNAESGDVVLISGKGHENYQITRQGKSFFDDRVEARKYLAA